MRKYIYALLILAGAYLLAAPVFSLPPYCLWSVDANGNLTAGSRSVSIGTTDLGTMTTGNTYALAGQVGYGTVDANAAITINLTGCTAGSECKKTLYLTNPGNGTASIAWQYGGAAKTPKYAAGAAPSYTASGLDVVVVTSINGGSTVNLFVAGQDVK